MRLLLKPVIAFIALAVAFGAATAAVQAASRRIVGQIVRFDAGVLEVQTANGEDVRAKLAPDVSISTREKSDLSHIKENTFLGTTAAPRADGTLVASEVHIFPEALRGLGEGHHAMTGTNTMTNATVSSVSRGASKNNTMTNATVANVGNADGALTLKLAYKGGEQTVVVPPDTPVMIYDRGTQADLKPDEHVIVTATTGADGGLVARRVAVGKNGYVPPI